MRVSKGAEIVCPRCTSGRLKLRLDTDDYVCNSCGYFVDAYLLATVDNIADWWHKEFRKYETVVPPQVGIGAKPPKVIQRAPFATPLTGLMAQMQNYFDARQQAMLDLYQQQYQSFISDYMKGGDMMRRRETGTVSPDAELIKLQNHLLSSSVVIDYSPKEAFPLLIQTQQLALALLEENHSEFLLGVEEQEKLYRRDYDMGRGWRGDISRETAKVWLDDNKGVVCARFPYKPEVIDQIRQRVPKGKKSWNPDDKIWEFSVEAVDVVVEILQKYYDDVIDLTQASLPPPPPVPGGSDPLLSLLDKDDIQKIRVLLSKKYHPDVGGDGDKMAKINEILNKVK